MGFKHQRPCTASGGCSWPLLGAAPCHHGQRNLKRAVYKAVLSHPARGRQHHAPLPGSGNKDHAQTGGPAGRANPPGRSQGTECAGPALLHHILILHLLIDLFIAMHWWSLGRPSTPTRQASLWPGWPRDLAWRQRRGRPRKCFRQRYQSPRPGLTAGPPPCPQPGPPALHP